MAFCAALAVFIQGREEVSWTEKIQIDSSDRSRSSQVTATPPLSSSSEDILTQKGRDRSPTTQQHHHAKDVLTQKARGALCFETS